uniref:lipopolysaccharide biosynthesis protein n=1 Tax=Roseivirga sp. TaxID=1964215 RepID=UPI004047F35B
MLNKLANVGLRGITLASKFALLLVLAKYLEPSDVGLYGLIAVTVAYGMYPLGFEFYTYSTREVIKAESAKKGQYLKSQMILHVLLYVLVLPIFTLIFYYEYLPWYVAPWFFVLVLTEHANQELMRMLIAIQKPVLATFVLFIRHGLWALLVALLFITKPEFRSLEIVLMAWSVSGLIAFLIAAQQTKFAIKYGWNLPVDWNWLRRGLKIALPMFVGTMSLNFIATIDRYWFESLVGADALGAYVFYMAIVAASVSFIDSGVFAFIYPAMVAASGRNDKEEFSLLLKKMFFQALSLAIVFAVITILMIDTLLSLISKPVYFDMKYLLYPMLVMMVIQVLSYVPNYALYTQNLDRAIIASNILSSVVFISSVSALAVWNELFAIPVALIFVYIFLLVFKYYSYRRMCRVQ